VIVTAQGTRNVEGGCDEALYRPYNNIKITPVTIKAIPYYLWGNRGEGEMIVWIRAK
jgi:DUF1680 family protein